MKQILQPWLKSDRMPDNYYELLGKPQCHDDREDLLRAVREAYQVLHDYEQHQDPGVVKRARHLQLFLGRAEHTFSNDSHWQDYDDKLKGKQNLKRKYETVGIDLGTTYSAIAYIDDHGKPQVAHNPDGHRPILPSAIFFDGDEIIVGETAADNACTYPDDVVQYVKRQMGQSQSVKLGSQQKEYTPETLSALILKKLISYAEPTIGPIQKAVVTVPAFFDEKRRAATEHAGTIADLDVVATLNEPSAALIAYHLHEVDREQYYVVYDLGGGTFDVTVMQVGKNTVQELASSGNRQLGGYDWDKALMEHVAGEFLRAHDSDPRDDPMSLQTLLASCRTAKRQLSDRKKTMIRCDHAGHSHRVEITREEFENLTQRLLSRTELTIEGCLRDAGLDWNRIEGVILVGGSTNMPMVKQMVRRLSGKEPLSEIDPELAVVLGAAVYAGVLESSGPQIATRSEPLKPGGALVEDGETDTDASGGAGDEDLELVDLNLVNAWGIGVLAHKNHERVNVVMIAKNSKLPTRATRSFKLRRDNPQELRINVTQGDSERVESCTQLGTCVLGPLPEGLPKGTRVDLHLGFDKNGRVELSAVEKSTETAVQAEIKTEGILTEEEVEQERRELLDQEPQ